MSIVFDSSGYKKRVVISAAFVAGSLLPTLIQFGPAPALISPWCWLEVLQDVFKIARGIDIHPAMLGLAPLAIIVFAAARPVSCIIATVWLSLNAITFWMLLATFRLEPAG